MPSLKLVGSISHRRAMATNRSPPNKTTVASATKRKMDQQTKFISNKRRSLRDRNSMKNSATTGKLSPMEIIGSLTFDVAKSTDGWSVKESRNGITKTFTSNCGKTFDSFESIGEFAIASKDWMEELADDEGAIDALKKIASGGDERAVRALGVIGISLEGEKAGTDDVVHRVVSPPDHANTKSKRNVIGIFKADYSIAECEIAEFRDKLGEFATACVEMFFASFIRTIGEAESKLATTNALVLKQIKNLERVLDDSSLADRMQMFKDKADLVEKKNEVEERKIFHEYFTKIFVGELAGQFLAPGFGLPGRLENKYSDLIRKYPVLKQVAFPSVNTCTKKL